MSRTVLERTAGSATRGYRVVADGWIGGRRVRKDDVIALTDAAAKYENVAPGTPAKTAKADAQK